jgi:hypothetical protein
VKPLGTAGRRFARAAGETGRNWYVVVTVSVFPQWLTIRTGV